MKLILHPEVESKLAALQTPGFYIVYGPAGIGKTTAVLSKLPTRSTQTIKPEKLNLTVKEVADIPRQFSLKESSDPTYLVLDDAHTMTHYAQNALLKTLEELPFNTTVVMVAHELESLLPTVRSRAHLLHLPPPTKIQLREWLQQADLSADQAQVLIGVTGNKPAWLNAYRADKDLIESELVRQTQFAKLLTGSLYERLSAAATLQEELPDILTKITQYARTRLRDSGDTVYQAAVIACERAQRLLMANCNKKLILDSIALHNLNPKDQGEVDG